MNTLIISSSLSSNSKSYILCKKIEVELKNKNVNCQFLDMRKINLQPYHLINNKAIDLVSSAIKKNDNIIIGMGVHNFSVSDNLKIILDTCFSEATGKFFGIVCAAGGEKSYLSTMHLTQICMNQWKMIQLPQIVYATSNDFKNEIIISSELKKIIRQFAAQFFSIGNKLIS